MSTRNSDDVPKHICLDLDGTLVDQIDGYYSSMVDTFKKYNLECPPKKLWHDALWNDDFSIMHPYGDDIDMWFEITDLYCLRHENISVFNHAKTFLDRAHSKNIKLTVATGRTISKNALKELLAYHQIENYFDEFMSYGEMDHTKVVQAKDVNKKAMFDYLLNKTNTDYENSWYVTDIAEDAHRALDFGFAKVFGTTTGGINPELFSAEITVITSLDEVNI